MKSNTKISLVVCTYQRPESLCKLLISIQNQTYYPHEIILVDGSTDDLTQEMINKFQGEHIKYFKITDEYRGLTKQRNFGISKVSFSSDLVAFLDDDLILAPDYFSKLIDVFLTYPDAIGAGGIDLLNNPYRKMVSGFHYNNFSYHIMDGWFSKEPLRYLVRKIFGLMPKSQPGIIPPYSNGRSALPPNDKVYLVEHFTGMSMMFRRKLFEIIRFSDFFSGYGLYEDFDFCVRSLIFGNLYVHTGANVWHYHDVSGRPNAFKYGFMVSRNGWYVWKQRFGNITWSNTLRWHFILLLLSFLRLLNFVIGPDRKSALLEFFGRLYGWGTILFYPPNIKK